MYIFRYKKLWLLLLICTFCFSVKAQQTHFVYLQTDNGQPFYVKLDNKVISSSAEGYVILPNITEGNYQIAVGFPKKEHPEEKFSLKAGNNNEGFVIKNFADNMPDVPAYVSDLNQVWTNLIDNALSALSKNGTLTVETSRDDKNILVSIIDNGSGISDEVMPHIFEPFFTTKKMGEGSGMGLDIIKRIIKHHNGDIKVKSQPGRTEFSVSLPMVQKPASN